MSAKEILLLTMVAVAIGGLITVVGKKLKKENVELIGTVFLAFGLMCFVVALLEFISGDSLMWNGGWRLKR